MLSPKRKQVLQSIRQHVEDNGYPPTIRDIVLACDMSSTSVADYHLKALEKEGYIRRDPGISRGIEIVSTNYHRSQTLSFPILGVISAGNPLPVPSSDSRTAEDTIDAAEILEDVSEDGENVYALQVKGKSMIDALIDDGDIVLLKYGNTAENGDLVAAWIEPEEEVTLKRFYQENGQIKLQPANTQMEPLFLKPEKVSIKGKVIGVIRRFPKKR